MRTQAKKKQQSRTVTLRVEAGAAGAAQGEDEEVSFSGVPLFEQASGEEGTERIDKISVIRMEPLEEGHVGYLEKDAAEEDISRRFGGGTYRLQAKTSYGKPVKGGFRTVKIAGEPKFESAFSLRRWRRMKQQEVATDEGDERPARRTELTALELWELQEKKAELARQQSKEEFDRRELERENAHKREMERLRIEADARERDRQGAEERRDRDRAAADERRAKDNEENQRRDREFYASLLRLQGENSKSGGLGSTLELLAAAKELFASGGDGGGDPITALVQNLPALLDRSQSIATSIQEQSQAAPAANAPGGPKKDSVTLTGAHAVKLAQVVAHLQREGIDPNRSLLRMLDAMGRLKGRQQQEEATEAQQAQPEGEAEGTEQAEAAAPAQRPAPRRPRVNVRRPGHRARR